MADNPLGAYNIFDLRHLALKRTDNTFKRPAQARAELRILDTARIAEG